ncbi:type 2 periplasmic-binding domain-containing protein [Rhodococcus triatomae]
MAYWGAKSLTYVVGVGMAAVLLAGCGSGSIAAPQNFEAGLKTWDEVLEAANSEGQLTVWTVQNAAVNKNLKEAFEKEFPEIDIDFAQYTPADLFPKVEAEQGIGASSADVLVQTDRFWHAQHYNEGWFNPIIGPEVLKADELVRNGSEPTVDGVTISNQLLYENNTRALSLYSPWGYAWNTSTTPSKPTFEDLFQTDTFHGAIGVFDPDTSPINVEFINKLNERYPSLISRLGDLDPVIFTLGGAVSGALAAGDIDAALGISQTAVAGKPNVGFAYDTNFPALATPVYAELLAKSPHPNAAQVFLNWALSVDGQKAWSRDAGSVRPDGAGANALSSRDIEIFESEGLNEAGLVEDRAMLNKAYGR